MVMRKCVISRSRRSHMMAPRRHRARAGHAVNQSTTALATAPTVADSSAVEAPSELVYVAQRRVEPVVEAWVEGRWQADGRPEHPRDEIGVAVSLGAPRGVDP